MPSVFKRLHKVGIDNDKDPCRNKIHIPLQYQNLRSVQQIATMQNGGSSDKADSQMEEDEWLVSCRCERAKSMYTLLSCLRNVGAFNNENRDLSMTQSRRRASTTSSAAIQPVTVFCYPGRMTFYVMGKSKQAQASITVQAGLFSKYNLFQQHDSRGEGDEKTNDWHSEGEVRIYPFICQEFCLLNDRV